MAASPTTTEQVPYVDPNTNASDPNVEGTDISRSDDSPSKTPDTANPATEIPEDGVSPSADSVLAPAAEVEVESGQPREDDDGNLTLNDLRAAVDEMDENLDDAFGQAADTFWNFATSVTGKVSSVVKGQPGLETLRQNVASRIPPLGNISRDIQSQIVTLAPDEKAIASITGSVKNVAETVQRNAVAMEEAILATANNVGDSAAETKAADRAADLVVDDPGVAALPEMQGTDGLDEIAAVGEKVSDALGRTVGGLWSGLWGTDDDDERDMEQKMAKLPKTRFGKRIFELQANPDTYCEPAEDLDAFEEWGKDFNLDNYETECMELLYTHDSIAELYEKVVPRVVEENTFWMRYFFAKHNLEMEEERRQKLLERAENAVEGADDDDDGWGDDDWDDESPDEDDGRTLPNKERSMEVSSQDANKDQEGAAASETPEPPTKENSMQNFAKTEAEDSEKTSTKGDNLHNGEKKEVKHNQEKPTAQVEIQEGEDDWGDDDWE